MAHSLYITGTEGSSGKTVVTLGLMHFLQSQVRKVAFFRPIIDSEDEARRDSSINLILKHFELDMLYRDTYACTYKEALELVTSGNMSLLIEKIFQKYKALENEYDFVLCQGTDFRDKDTAVQFELNSEIAARQSTTTSIFRSRSSSTARINPWTPSRPPSEVTWNC